MRQPRPFALLIALVVAAAAAIAPAIAFAAFQATGTSTVTFTATGSMGLRIVGTTHELNVTDNSTQLTVNVPLSHLSTGIALRDRHLNDHLDVAHHGTAQLVVPLAALHVPTAAATSGTARGTLRVKGHTQPVDFRYRAERAANGQIHIHATARIDMTKFNMTAPSYLGVEVHKEVDLVADFSLRTTT